MAASDRTSNLIKNKPVWRRRLPAVAAVLVLLIPGCNRTHATPPYPEGFKIIPTRQVFDTLLERPISERTTTGQILSEAGLARFEAQYGVKVEGGPFDFSRESLVFGITDQIHNRAVQLVEPPEGRPFLDYVPTGIKYKLRLLPSGMDYDYLQVFRVQGRISSIYIGVRDLLADTPTQRYE